MHGLQRDLPVGKLHVYSIVHRKGRDALIGKLQKDSHEDAALCVHEFYPHVRPKEVGDRAVLRGHGLHKPPCRPVLRQHGLEFGRKELQVSTSAALCSKSTKIPGALLSGFP